MSEGRQEYERKSGETTKAFDAFRVYRDMPSHERSIRKAVRLVWGEDHISLTSKYRQWQAWSSLNDWVSRAQAWDDEKDRAATQERLREIRVMQERHAKQAMLLQRKAIERLQSLSPEDLTPSEVVRYIDTATTIERLARGEADSSVEVRHGFYHPRIKTVVVRLDEVEEEEIDIDDEADANADTLGIR